MTTPNPISGSPAEGIIPGKGQPKRPLTITIYGEFDDSVKASVEFGTLDKSGKFAADKNPEVEAGRKFDAETDSIVVATFVNDDAAPGARHVRVKQGSQYGASKKPVVTLVKEDG